MNLLQPRRRQPSRLRLVSLSLAAVAIVAGCPADGQSIRLATVMAPHGTSAFGKLIKDYNDQHPATPIKWQNYPSEQALVSDTTARGWAVVGAGTARLLPDGQAFVSAVSPRLLDGYLKGFVDQRRTSADGTFLPLLGVQPLLIADIASINKTVGGIPPTIGKLLDDAKVYRQKSGRYYFAPAFGDADQVLRFIHSQGAMVIGLRNNAEFPKGELVPLLQPWVDAYRRGDLPKASVDWDEATAARMMIAGQADMTLGGFSAVDVVAARPDKTSRRFSFFRPSTGVIDDQWVEPIGLVRLGGGTVSMAAQNMIAFLMTEPAQSALAAGYEAVPLVSKALDAYGANVTARTPARAVYLESVCLHVVHGFPLAPVDPNRQVVAQAIRLALKDAVQGMPVEQAVAKAEAWYDSQSKASAS